MQEFERWANTVRGGAQESFDAFLARREAISGEYISGDPTSLLGISTSSDPATFFPPSGDVVQGASKVNAVNEQGAKAFATGSVGRFEVMQSGSSGGFGFWTGIQHAEVMMNGKDKPVSVRLRTTEIFRAEQSTWEADPPTRGPWPERQMMKRSCFEHDGLVFLAHAVGPGVWL